MTTFSAPNSLTSIAGHLLSDSQMEAHRERARDCYNGNAAWRAEQHATHLGTQKSGGKDLAFSFVESRPNGSTTTIAAVFAYKDGTAEEFDGSQWRKVAYPQPR